MINIEFAPSHEFGDTPLTLRDNSPNDPWLINKVLSDPDWMAAFGLIHIVIGYNPQDNGSKLFRGCGNSCPSCIKEKLTPKDIGTDPLRRYLISLADATPSSLITTLGEMLQTSTIKMEEQIERPIGDTEKIIRLSGNVRGDPVMADYPTSQRILHMIKENFPGYQIHVDTTANQYVMESNRWKELGADRIMVSVNAVNSEEAYMTFHGIGRGRFGIAKQNIRYIDAAGVGVGLSYVYGSHETLPKEIRNRMPKYVLDGQTEEARGRFIESLDLQQRPIERLWRFQTGSEADFQRIIDGDKRYRQLQ